MEHVLYRTIRTLATALQVDVADLVGSSRKHDIVEARYVIAYVLRQRFAQLTLDEIGAVLGGRHRATIVYGLRIIAERAASDADLRALLVELVATSKQKQAQDQQQAPACESVCQAAAPDSDERRVLRTLLTQSFVSFVIVCRPPAA